MPSQRQLTARIRAILKKMAQDPDYPRPGRLAKNPQEAQDFRLLAGLGRAKAEREAVLSLKKLQILLAALLETAEAGGMSQRRAEQIYQEVTAGLAAAADRLGDLVNELAELWPPGDEDV